MALGAAPRDVVAAFVRHGMTLVAIGMAIGLAGAVVIARVFRSLLFGIVPTDPATLVTAAIVLALAGLAACWIPARFAARISPVTALRQ